MASHLPTALPWSRDHLIFVAKKKVVFLSCNNLNILSHKIQETPVKLLLAALCHLTQCQEGFSSV